ncbi:hypothetical protein FOL47_009774 [Perkinsus chesapeaki]|uniref:Chitin-binding type-4 domain-containing protein n=1 Tax=Perkinsus chesapeaki TaxID=330153 RepID=A0A7J6L6L0_PERCH|nr:hypothetical protein FOL47_009774 [Perkinsus chesapeaki]
MVSLLSIPYRLTVVVSALVYVARGHSWMFYLEGDIEDGYPRMGLSGPDDDYFTRYICPLRSLDDCFLEPKHEIVLDQSSLRPCRASGSPGAPNVEDIAAVTAGKALRIFWKNNGHTHGESDGTCVQIRIAPYSADPDWSDFKILELCLPYHVNHETSAVVRIPEQYSGKYVIHWMWKFGPFYFGTCADIAITNENAGGSVKMEAKTYTEAPKKVTYVPKTSSSSKPLARNGAQNVMDLYKQKGCGGLDNPGEFCYEYYGTYCKLSAGADYCGRHICHESDHTELGPCQRLRRRE